LKKEYNANMVNAIDKKRPKEITIRSTVRFGKPTIDGTRVAVADVISLLKAGYTVYDIPKQYPSVTTAGTISALEYTANILGKEETLVIS